jgi:hypothetical protein
MAWWLWLVFLTHPCDAVTPSVFRLRVSSLSAVIIGFCAKPEDDAPLGFLMQIDGGDDIDLGLVPPLTEANLAGYRYYETQHAALRPGLITIKAYYAGTESDPSRAILFLVRGKVRK